MLAIRQTILLSLTSTLGLLAMSAAICHGQNLSFTLPALNGEPVAVHAHAGASNQSPAIPTTDKQIDEQITAVCFLGTECPMARAYTVQLNALHTEFAARGVRIIGVMSNRQDTLEEIAEFADELQTVFPLVHDEQNEIADRYGAQRTPEVFLLDEQLKLRYHGRIDDRLAPGIARAKASRQDLRIAIEELLVGKPVSIPATTALGCIIGRVPKADAPAENSQGITYTNQVARVLQTHCIECHRPGEIGPFAMDRYDQVVGWAETMLETVEQHRMPPWHADPEFGDYANARVMPEEDKQVLRDWIAGGLQRGDDADLPAPLEFTAGWNLPRPPDLEVAMRTRPFTVPKDGVVEYQYFVADPGLEEDTWITAAQVIPGRASVVHHAIVFVRPPDGSEFPGIGWLSAYIPGQRVHTMPEGYARKIPAGSKFVFQMHYTPNGVQQADVTRVGLVTCDASQVSHEVFTLMALDQDFEIPPGAENFPVQASTRRLPEQSELLAITPHMHVRGKSFRLFGASGQDETLLYVPQYDFNWQHTYLLQKPLPLDAFDGGLQFKATFDNSANNPFNPDPTETITWGDQTWEEMAVAFFEVARPLKTAGSAPRVRLARAAGGRTDATLGAESEGESTEATQSPAAVRHTAIEAYMQRVFAALDANSDGEIHKSEVDIVVRRLHFDLWDLDDDHVITADEVRQVAERLHPVQRS